MKRDFAKGCGSLGMKRHEVRGLLDRIYVYQKCTQFSRQLGSLEGLYPC
jgi:hypothetical protein